MFPIYTYLTERIEKAISMRDGCIEHPLIQDHHIVIKKKKTKNKNKLCLTKLNSNKLYKIQIIIKYKKPTSQSYFEKIFNNSNLDWKTIYLLPHIAAVDMTICVFQYKLLNNVLFLNKMLYRCGIL